MGRHLPLSESHHFALSESRIQCLCSLHLCRKSQCTVLIRPRNPQALHSLWISKVVSHLTAEKCHGTGIPEPGRIGNDYGSISVDIPVSYLSATVLPCSVAQSQQCKGAATIWLFYTSFPKEGNDELLRSGSDGEVPSVHACRTRDPGYPDGKDFK